MYLITHDVQGVQLRLSVCLFVSLFVRALTEKRLEL